jgi:G2/M phase-specific E3 ubiquitin-protein ligase
MDIDSQPTTSKASYNTTASLLKSYDLKTGLIVDLDSKSKLNVCLDEETTLICDVCKSPEKNHNSYGTFFKTMYTQCHYFCLLLCSKMQQSGLHDTAGILGFERGDILRGRQLVASEKCCYCDNKSANLECAQPNCEQKFHLVCGFKNKCHFDFVEFVAYCDQHTQIEHDKEKVEAFDATDFCYTCFDEIGEYHPVTCVLPKCCQLGWSHRECLRKFANNAGYKFRCTLCTDTIFRQQARRDGIFVPDR